MDGCLGVYYLYFNLGYQHQPVLSESEMLTLHSPEFVDNVLSTKHDVKVVAGSKGGLTFVFKTVIDLNVFIFDKCSREKAKTLGELKMKVEHLKLMTDDDGLYRVSSKDPRSKLEPLADKYKFELKDIRLGVRTLCFRSKADMFEFLLDGDEKISSLNNLRLDQTLIASSDSEESMVGKIPNESIQENPYSADNHLTILCSSSPVVKTEADTAAEEESGILDVGNDDDSALNDSCATEASVYEAVIAQKDDEIRLLKSQLNQKDDLIKRSETEAKKIEKKFFEKQEVVDQITMFTEQINKIVSKSSHHIITEIKKESFR